MKRKRSRVASTRMVSMKKAEKQEKCRIIQRAWRAHARWQPVNSLDPISLDPVGNNPFCLVQSNGCKTAYIAPLLWLHVMAAQTDGGPARDPLTGRDMHDAEVNRLRLHMLKYACSHKMHVRFHAKRELYCSIYWVDMCDWVVSSILHLKNGKCKNDPMYIQAYIGRRMLEMVARLMQSRWYSLVHMRCMLMNLWTIHTPQIATVPLCGIVTLQTVFREAWDICSLASFCHAHTHKKAHSLRTHQTVVC